MQQLIYVHQGDHHTTFALIEDGVYRFVQYHNNQVRQAGNCWDLIPGARYFHASVRRANAHETINVDGAELSGDILAALGSLPAALAA